MDYYQYLNQISTIDKADYEALSECFQERSVEKGALILKEGEIQQELLLVLEGVQMSYHYHRDKLNVLAFTYPPSASGIPESFMTQKPSAFCLEAMSDSRFYAINYDDLQGLLKERPSLTNLYQKMTSLLFIGTLQRCIELQAYTMEERFRAFAARSPHLFQLIAHKYLASYLNISPTNFSKLYNRIRIGG
jgi:CRP-like cAMP-binding protein